MSRLHLNGLRGALPELEGRNNELCKLKSADIERNLETKSRTVQSISHSISHNSNSIATVEAYTLTQMVKNPVQHSAESVGLDGNLTTSQRNTDQLVNIISKVNSCKIRTRGSAEVADMDIVEFADKREITEVGKLSMKCQQTVLIVMTMTRTACSALTWSVMTEAISGNKNSEQNGYKQNCCEQNKHKQCINAPQIQCNP